MFVMFLYVFHEITPMCSANKEKNHVRDKPRTLYYKQMARVPLPNTRQHVSQLRVLAEATLQNPRAGEMTNKQN